MSLEKPIQKVIFLLLPISIGVMAFRINENHLGVLPSDLNLTFVYQSAIFGYLFLFPFILYLLFGTIMAKKKSWRKIQYLHSYFIKKEHRSEFKFFFWSWWIGIKDHFILIILFIIITTAKDFLVCGELRGWAVFSYIIMMLTISGITSDHTKYGPRRWSKPYVKKDLIDRGSEVLRIYGIDASSTDVFLVVFLAFYSFNASSEQRKYLPAFGGFRSFYGKIEIKEHESKVIVGSIYALPDGRVLVLSGGKQTVFPKENILAFEDLTTSKLSKEK